MADLDIWAVSDHPLVHVLRETTSKPVVGILESAITHSLFLGHRFGIITTGTGYGYIYHKGATCSHSHIRRQLTLEKYHHFFLA